MEKEFVEFTDIMLNLEKLGFTTSSVGVGMIVMHKNKYRIVLTRETGKMKGV